MEIGDACEVEKGATIGNKVTIGDATYIGAGAIIGNDVKLGSGCHVERGCYVPNGTRVGDATRFTTLAPEEVLLDVAHDRGLVVTFNNKSCAACGAGLTFEEKPDGSLPKAVTCGYCNVTSEVQVQPTA